MINIYNLKITLVVQAGFQQVKTIWKISIKDKNEKENSFKWISR